MKLPAQALRLRADRHCWMRTEAAANPKKCSMENLPGPRAAGPQVFLAKRFRFPAQNE